MSNPPSRSTLLALTSQNTITPTTSSPLLHSMLHWPLTDNVADQTFPRHTKEDYVLVGLLHAVGLILALTGNCSVIVIIARTKRLHTPSSLLVLLLAVSDLLLSLLWNLVPLLLTFDDKVSRMLIQSGIACNVIGFAWQTMLTTSTLTHTVVAIDRYLFIVHPMKYQVYVTSRATSFLACAVISIACLLASLILISGHNFRFLQVTGMCIGSPLWSLLYLFLVFIPSLTVAVFAYQRIWRLCSSFFKREDIHASRGRFSRVCFSSNYPLPLSLSSSRNHSRSDLSTIMNRWDSKVEEHFGLASCQNNSIVNDPKPSDQKHVLTTVTTHSTSTKITEKNTTTTTTIASTLNRPYALGEDPETNQSLHKDRIIERKISEVKKIEVEKSTSTDRQRTESVSIHTTCNPTKKSFSCQESKQPNENCKKAQPMRSRCKSLGSQCSNTNKRSHSKDSLFPFLQQNKRQTLKPFIVTTFADSMSSLSNTDDNSSAIHMLTSSLSSAGHLGIADPLSTIKTTGPQNDSYETITEKLFGNEAILPSLLYVAILMPLSMQPVSSVYKHRRLRACLLIGLPVLIMAVSFLPFPGSLIYLGYIQMDENVGDSAGMFLIKLICHMSFALVPSLTSLLLCLSNKPYRWALRQLFKCRCT